MHKREPDPGGVLARWSARKAAARRGEPLTDDEAPPAAPEQEQEEARGLEPEQNVPELTDADMPPLETLTDTSDYSGFLSRGVSESLRKQALARLFRGSQFQVTDGMDDYAEDFTRFVPLGNLITADMRHRIEEATKRLAAEDPAAGTDADPAPTTPHHEHSEAASTGEDQTTEPTT